MQPRPIAELFYREVEGENSAEESAAFRAAMERQPPPHLKRAILAALPAPPQPNRFWNVIGDLSWAIHGGGSMNRKALIIGTSAVAVIAIIGSLVVGFPPGSNDVAGTIGGTDPGVSGVQQASRYRGRTMTQADVTLQNPEIQALFQNDQVLRLVKSDVFREAMRDEAFRSLQQSDAYRAIMQNEAYRQLQQSEAYRAIMQSEAYRQLAAMDAFRQLEAQGAFRQAQSAEAMRQINQSEAYRQIQAMDAFRQLQMSDAFRQLQASETFRALTRSAQLSEAFLSEAMRAEMRSAR